MLQESLDLEFGSMPSILIVDDDTEVVMALCEFFSECGYQVDGAKSGYEAMECLDRRGLPFDVALVDHNLPDMNGVTLARSIRDRSPDTAVGLLTGLDGPLPVDRSIDAVARKPIKLDGLQKMIRGLHNDSYNSAHAVAGQ